MSYRRSSDSPGPLLITLIAVALVFGSYLMWTGFREWLDEGSENTRNVAATAEANLTATYDFFVSQPTLVLFPTNTPVPACQYYTVKGPQAAFVRACPSTSCDDVTFIEADEIVCVIGRASSAEYSNADEWFEIIIDPDEFIPEIAYMNEITLKSNNPTPQPTNTPPPLITVTPLPAQSRSTVTPAAPSITPSPTAEADDGRSF